LKQKTISSEIENQNILNAWAKMSILAQKFRYFFSIKTYF